MIAGFQGIHKETGRITTLGRGGSDTSAVAIAAAIQADRCDIYTDVDGVYTTDPRVVPKARRLEKVAFEEMLELASLGAKVLQVRSVELGMVHKVRIFVRSSFEKPEDIDPMSDHPPGTLICDEEEIVEQQVVTGIAFSKDEAQISIRRVQDKPGVAAAIFGPLAEASINVDMIVQNVSADGKTTDLTFTVPAADYQRSMDVIGKAKDAIGFDRARRRERRRQGVRHRHRDAQPCRRRVAGVQGVGGAQHQYPRDHHLGDQVFRADRRSLYRTCGAHAARALRSRQVIAMADAMPPLTSYSQRFEDLYLGCCFPDRRNGFYIDIGAGHPVYDNVSFAFYLKGWRGIAVEPNPSAVATGQAACARATAISRRSSARPRVRRQFHLVNDFHGLSTMIADHARKAESEFGKASRAMTMPVTSLASLCEQHAPAAFEFLKIDVEGAEDAVIRGGDWKRFRPKVVVVEALAPYSLAPAWDAMGADPDHAWLSLCPLRQPQPLLCRRRGNANLAMPSPLHPTPSMRCCFAT